MIKMAQTPELHVIYKQLHIGGMIVYKRNRPPAKVLVDAFLHFIEISNFCKASVYLVSFALFGARSVKNLNGL